MVMIVILNIMLIHKKNLEITLLQTFTEFMYSISQEEGK